MGANIAAIGGAAEAREYPAGCRRKEGASRLALGGPPLRSACGLKRGVRAVRKGLRRGGEKWVPFLPPELSPVPRLSLFTNFRVLKAYTLPLFNSAPRECREWAGVSVGASLSA